MLEPIAGVCVCCVCVCVYVCVCSFIVILYLSRVCLIFRWQRFKTGSYSTTCSCMRSILSRSTSCTGSSPSWALYLTSYSLPPPPLTSAIHTAILRYFTMLSSFTMLYSFISDGLLSCTENYKLVVECTCGVKTRTQHILKPTILRSLFILKSIILSFNTAVDRISSSLNAVPSTCLLAIKLYCLTGTTCN